MPIEKDLVVDKICFTYASSEIPVLNEVSFTLNCGESLGVVGASGAGKSTLVDILLGLHLPSSGRLLADGRDVVTNMPGWQSGIGLVPQDVYLIDDTLAANIAFGVDASEIDHELLREVVIQSQLSHFVEGLPLGLESIVGERGVRISGGQRQRIGIARSLYARPNLLILDEATSALDNETELRISETIESLHGMLTMVVVAHRLSTIRKCDRILFLESGTVRDIGSFDELVERDPEFANLARLALVNAPEPEPRETIAPPS
jgi:ABC-type multidrug transport system fused ATPase/permease subunit